jgi:pyruvate dehydrogenase E2 component (dihydrolipoamide acetyltransferase)
VVNPVLPDVLALGLVEIAAVREATVGRARAGRLVPSDLGAAPTTLSNLGAFGVDQFTGIVTPGQLTVITVGALRPRVTADSEGRIAVRDTVFVTVNADHRELDGADAARLLGALEAAVSDIERLLDNEKEV